MLTNNYKPFVGGVPISIERLSQGLRNLGHVVYIFAPRYGNEEEEPFVIRYRSRKKKLKGEIIVPDIFDSTIVENFSKLSFDVVHVHHPMLVGYTAQYLKKKYHIPLVFTYHTRYEQYLHYIRPYEILQKHCHRIKTPMIRSFGNKIIRGMEDLVTIHNRIFTNHCDMVFAPSFSMKNYLEENGTITDVKVIPTGLQKDDFEYDSGKVKFIRNKYSAGKDLLFCTVSRLEKEKNILFILKGLKRLKKRRGDCFRFLIIGEGSERQNLMMEAENLGIKDNVIFCGSIAHKELSNYYRACDLLLFASKSETQGIVLLEAMAAGLPIVAVYASGVCDVVRNGYNGYMTDMNVNTWEEKIEQIIDNKLRKEQMRRNAIIEAKQYLSTNIAKNVERYYNDILICRNGEQVYEAKII